MLIIGGQRPYYFSRFVVNINKSIVDMEGLKEFISRTLERFFVVKSCQLMDGSVEIKLGNLFEYIFLGSLIPSFRKFIPVSCTITLNSVSEFCSTEIVLEFKLRDPRPRLFNSTGENAYVQDAAHSMEHSVKEYLTAYAS